jgi:cobalt-zinc-cadmium efflux system protein
MGHQHGHRHAPEDISDQGLLWAVGLNIGLSGFEVVAAVIAGSVALMADALHNFNDCAALFIAYVARKISRRAANERFTFSYRRTELVGAMINLTALVVVGLYLIYEALRRIIEPQELSGGWMMAAAGVALVVDVITAWLLWAMSKGSMNVRAAFVHNLTDALASVAVLAGGAAVYFFGWDWLDPVLTLAIAGYILYLSVGMLRRTASILMEGTPEGLELRELRQAVEQLEGVDDLHHLHVWQLDEGHRALEAHIAVSAAAISRIEEIKARIKHLLEDGFSIQHSTLEFEIAGEACCEDDRRLIPRHR